MSNERPTAIVTGASSGIGLATTRALLARGFNVVMNGSNPDRLAAAHEALGAPDEALPVAGDVGGAGDRARLVEAALSRFGRIDVLVNNAGIFEPRPFLEVDEAYLDRFLTTNLKGTFFLTQAVIPHMREAGGGSVVNVGTVLVDHALAGVPASAAVTSKGAIHTLTVQLAAEFGRDNIRVNTIAPGIIRTPIHARNGIEDADSLAGLHLVNRIGEPEDVAEVATQLATNTFISGTVVNVDGGHAAGHAVQ
ncbi:MAG: SDR family NAD(P)-dependent oxidoreductase [Alphaproteobacteria bacterium]